MGLSELSMLIGTIKYSCMGLAFSTAAVEQLFGLQAVVCSVVRVQAPIPPWARGGPRLQGLVYRLQGLVHT